MGVHLRDLRYFLAVAEERSFTRAAGRLFVAQPTLSKQVRRLEAELRTPLFERDRHGVSLTPAGEALVPHARALLGRWDDARHDVAGAARTLTVGFHLRIGRGLVPSVRARMEGWRLRFRQVSWGDPAAGLADGVDVALAWLPVPDDGRFAWKVVSTEERWVVLPAGHRLADRAGVRFADLADEPFVAHPASAGALRAFWLAEEHRVTPARVAAEAESADELLELVAAGVGVALLPAGNADTSPRFDVVCRPVTGLPPGRLAVVWRAGDRRAVVREFAESCSRCLCYPADGALSTTV
ncbi:MULTISPECIES: LysR family transcriptional regulator [unclassified Saccharothrix]|uniref:LysR family transcriptional regulator n=1 Tax=unclassified Saccharothrix TaxID=2593673 RepID=UPI00307D2607